jgi:hypothetical protein
MSRDRVLESDFEKARGNYTSKNNQQWVAAGESNQKFVTLTVIAKL